MAFQKERDGRVNVGAVLLGAAALLAGSGCSSEGLHHEAVVKVRAELTSSGTARVTILLNDTGSTGALGAAQNAVGDALVGAGSEVVHKFKTGPGMSVELSSELDLEMLATHPSVDRFDVTMIGQGGLNDTRAIVGADEAFAAGFTGQGRTVAVLDSGMEATHDDLGGALVDEACFVNVFGLAGCPDGGATMFGPGAAADDHGHGSHVTGIITSDGVGPAPRGVAPDTDIVAVKVLNAFNEGSFDDWVAALEWVNDNHPEVDAVNMSLQGFLFPADCDLVASPSPDIVNFANAINALRDNGVLTVVCAGNFFSSTQLAAPACVSGAIAVGATDKNNAVTAFSNSNEGLEIFAPGDGFVPDEGVVSAGLGNSTANFSGTSMSTPHVTAAVALLYEQNPDLDAEQALECVLTSETQITDSRNGLVRPLLDIPAALAACGADCNTRTYEAETMFHSTGGPAPSGWNIWSNGFISTNHAFDAGPARITVRARGQSAAGIAPHMVVSVGGVAIGNAFVPNTAFADVSFDFVATAGTREVRVAFDNDFFQPPQDRNLFVDRVTVDCVEPTGRPCDAFCANAQPISWTGSYQSGALGTGAICREATQPVVGGNCGNFSGGRQLFVNGVQQPCNTGNWPSVPGAVNGGYCIQATAGQFPWAFVTLW